jgi:hypothetical protein
MGDVEIFLVIEAILLGRHDCHSNVTSFAGKCVFPGV